MKVFQWISQHILFIITLFFLAFIPLYPKLPLFDIKHTWVYIRIEDFLVAAAVITFIIQWVRKKVQIKTPITWPIVAFWAVGGLSTLLGILFIFPTISNVFPNVAILHFLRRIEYISLFFIAFAAMRDKKYVPYVVATLAITLLLVVMYGLGQRGFLIGWENRFPAFSTMNEEFAKGIPLHLSALARITSTFAGHYDLAAYLVMLIPIMGSMVFGYRNWFLRVFFTLSATSGLILLLMTASRTSFGVYLLTIAFLLIIQKQKKFIIPVFIASILLLNSFEGISQRFASTFSQVDLVVDARTGKAIGVAREFTDSQNGRQIVIEDKELTGEDLPEGSSYINLPSDSSSRYQGNIIYKRTRLKDGQQTTEITSKAGDVIVKKAFAYDVSFTTRFQGEWPRAWKAFERNMLLGSGYSSINLATDNNYLRIIGEVGILGFSSFILIFIFAAIYVWRVLPHVDSKPVRSLTLGVVAAIFGLALNAVLIDVFEASKVAFVLWLLMGVILGLLHLYQKNKINYFKEMRTVLLSTPAVIIYFLIATFTIFSPMLNNYFVGDDFTWLRWAADCKQIVVAGMLQCEPIQRTVINYFTQSDGFFYRPGTKLYFSVMYPFFEIFPFPYHIISVFLHFISTALVFLITSKILKSRLFGFVASLLFLLLSAHAESIFWISVTGHLIASVALLFSMYMYLVWREGKSIIFLILSFLSIAFSMLFHEFGVVGPIILIGLDVVYKGIWPIKKLLNRWYYVPLVLLIPAYYLARNFANSVWFHGDYNYDLSNGIFNTFGNLIGYFFLSIIGPISLIYYQQLRSFGRENLIPVILGVILCTAALVIAVLLLVRKVDKDDIKRILVGLLLFVIPLLTFLPLGNITSRYLYLGSVGIVFLAAFLLQKAFNFFSKIDQRFAFVLLGIILAAISYFHTKELYRVNDDWQKAGNITNNLLIDLNYAFAQEPSALSRKPIFYFVNVPIRTGEAWIFPVGLEDALWFTFRDERPTIRTFASLEEAFSAINPKDRRRTFVFEFDKDGKIELVRQAISPQYAE